jgi:flagellar hook-associated protein 2
VSQLAQEASLASGVIASGANLTGSLTIDLGTYNSATPPAFTARSGSTSLNLNFTDPATTLLDVRDAINAAQAGIQATVITDGAGQRLVISSSDTGADRALRVAVSGGSAGGLNGLAYDGSPASTLVQTRAARDAQFTINGLSLTSASNTLDGTVQGLKLQLLKTTSTALDITVTNDTAGQRKLVDDFVTAYNAINSQISTDTGYDATNKKSGLFQGDATALAVRRMLRDAVGLTGTASSTLGRLSDLGIDIQRSGALAVDGTKFAAALANGAEVSKFFSAAGTGTDASKGVGLRIKDIADQLLGSEGVLPNKASALKTTLDRNQADQERLNTRVEATRARLLRQYQSLDAKMSQFTALGSYVTKQFSSN